MNHFIDCHRVQAANSPHDGLIRLMGCGKLLEDFDLAVANDDKVRECSTSIDADPRNRSVRHLGRVLRKRFPGLESYPAGRAPRSAPEGQREPRRNDELRLREPT